MLEPSRVERVHEQFDRAWRRAESPDIRQTFAEAVKVFPELSDADARRKLLTKLIPIDLEYRWRRWSGEEDAQAATFVENYRAWFDDLQGPKGLPVELVEAEFKARVTWGDDPELDEFCRRFRNAATTLRNRLLVVKRQAEESGAKLPKLGVDYKALQKCGEGSYGLVFRARHLKTKRIVAVKMLAATWAGDDKAVKDFRRELQALAQIDHPHVIPLYEARQLESEQWLLAFKFAGGGSLRQRLNGSLAAWRDDQTKEPREFQKHVAQLVWKIVTGLGAAHDKKLVHRDLKPENILFDERNEPMIADFGAARAVDETLTSHGARLGTTQYMAPEQLAEATRADVRSDIYSVGVMLFELLTGDRPFPETPLMEAVRDLTLDAPSARSRDSRIDPELAVLCGKCLEKRPEDRFGSASELAAELERFLTGTPILTPGLSRSERLKRWSRRHRVKLMLGAAASVVIGVSAALINEALDEAAAAEQRRKELDKTVVETSLRLDQATQTAESAEANAARSAGLAKLAEEHKRCQQYAADLQEVEQSWETGDTGRMRELLGRYEAKPELRGFEWAYWARLLEDAGVVLEDNRRPVRDIAIDPTGRYLAATDFQRVSLWDLKDREKQAEFVINARRQSNVWSHDKSFPADDSVAFSPDGRYLAATGFVLGHQDRWGAVKVWEVASGREVVSITNDSMLSGRAVTFSPDGRYVVAGVYRNGWRSWSVDGSEGAEAIGVEIGRRMSAFGGSRPMPVEERIAGTSTTGPLEIVRTLRFAQDGASLFACCFHSPQTAWNWPKGTLHDASSLQAEAGYGQLGVTLPAEGAGEAMSLDDGVIHLHLYRSPSPWPTAAVVERIALNWPTIIDCFDYRRGLLAVGDHKRAVSVWVAENGRLGNAPLIVHRGHGADVTCVSLTEEGTVVSGDRKGTIRIWPQEEPGRLALSLDGQGTAPDNDSSSWSLLSPDERFIANSSQGTSSGAGPLLEVSRVDDSKRLFSLTYGPKLLSADTLAFSADATTIAAVTSLKSVKVWSLKDGALVGEIAVPEAFRVALDSQGRRIAIGARNSISIWTISPPKKLCDIPQWDAARGVMPPFLFSADDSWLVVEGHPDSIWEATTGKPASLPDDEVEAFRRLVGEHRSRLYRVLPESLELYCGRTLQRLATIPTKWGTFSDPMAFSPVAGADGAGTSPTLDRLLDKIVAQWKPSRPQ